MRGAPPALTSEASCNHAATATTSGFFQLHGALVRSLISSATFVNRQKFNFHHDFRFCFEYISQHQSSNGT